MIAEARRERPEAVARIRVGAEADDGERAAVEVVRADDDLGAVRRHALHFVAPLAHGLERGFDRLGAAVHRQDLVRVGELREVLVEEGELVVAEGARGERQLLRLLDHRGEDLRVAVALVHGGVGREAVEVALAVDVPDPDALAADQHDVERLVVVRAETGLDRDQVPCPGAEAGIRIKHLRSSASACSCRTTSRRGPRRPPLCGCALSARDSAPPRRARRAGRVSPTISMHSCASR